MTSFTRLAALLLAALVSLSAAAPAFSAPADSPLQRLFSFERNSSKADKRDPNMVAPEFRRQTVRVRTSEKPGTIIVNTKEHFLYFVLDTGTAIRYGVGVGREGFEWSGTNKVSRKAEWPGWTPPAEMRKRQPGLPAYMPGGPSNPLGARALYIGSTLYRIHGTNEPWSIGRSMSSGCIRMLNEDVMDLYERVKIGAKVVVL